MNERAARPSGALGCLTIGAGALLGAVVGVVGLLVLARVGAAPTSGAFLLAPGAYLVSWVTGWPLQQESALMCYAASSVLTPAILGAIVGGGLGAAFAGRTRAG